MACVCIVTQYCSIVKHTNILPGHQLNNIEQFRDAGLLFVLLGILPLEISPLPSLSIPSLWNSSTFSPYIIQLSVVRLLLFTFSVKHVRLPHLPLTSVSLCPLQAMRCQFLLAVDFLLYLNDSIWTLPLLWQSTDILLGSEYSMCWLWIITQLSNQQHTEHDMLNAVSSDRFIVRCCHSNAISSMYICVVSYAFAASCDVIIRRKACCQVYTLAVDHHFLLSCQK